jgi:hypothetical protein
MTARDAHFMLIGFVAGSFLGGLLVSVLMHAGVLS